MGRKKPNCIVRNRKPEERMKKPPEIEIDEDDLDEIVRTTPAESPGILRDRSEHEAALARFGGKMPPGSRNPIKSQGYVFSMHSGVAKKAM